MRKMVRLAAFLSFPLLFGLGLVAEEFIVLVITDKWLFSAELMQVLCVAGAVIPLHTLMSNATLSCGHSGVNFGCTCGLGVASIVVMVCIWPLGIRTMVVAYTVLNVLWVFVWLFFVRRLFGYGYAMFLRDTLPFAFAAAAVMVATGLATAAIGSLAAKLAARIVLATALYYAVMRVARVGILAECQRFVVSKLRKG